LKNIIKYITGKTVQPLIAKYLSKQRVYRYKGIRLQVPSQVFHPAFFFSTRLLLQYIDRLDLAKKTFLELGAGSGLIAFNAAKKGALVTATDISLTAVEFLKINQNTNNIPLQVIASDLFNDIPRQHFDIIAINPPYYKKNPETENDYAWYCGEDSSYFTLLFKNLGCYINDSSEVYMILCDGCDIELIKVIAAQYNFHFELMKTKKNIVETNYIFKIKTTGLQYA